MSSASCSVKRSIASVPNVPTARNKAMAVLKQRRIWLRRPVALASLMSLLRASGRPAVDSVSKKA